jgi:hypothetical protein
LFIGSAKKKAHRLVLELSPNGCLNLRIRLKINSSRCLHDQTNNLKLKSATNPTSRSTKEGKTDQTHLIQDHDPRLRPDQRPRQRNKTPLTDGEILALLFDDHIERELLVA